MNVYWVIAEEIQEDVLDTNFISTIAPSWGSYKTWQEYETDNCISNILADTKDLLQRGFDTVCNLWVPEQQFIDLDRPSGLHLFGGTFDREDYPYKDNIVSMHLACTNADIILMLGFDLSTIEEDIKGDERIDRMNYYLNMSKFFKEHNDVQFVLVNNTTEISSMFDEISNFSSDTADAVKELLN